MSIHHYNVRTEQGRHHTIEPMKQSSLGLGTLTKRTRRREFLDQMDRVVPWSDLVAEIAPYMPEGKRGHPPFPVASLRRIHFMQQWFTLSDPAMKEALHDMPLFRDFAGLDGWDNRLLDESTILRFRHVLEKHKLAERILATVNLLLGAKDLMPRSGTVVDATQFSAPSSNENADRERGPKMHQSKKGQQWFFGMKAHIGVDADSDLAHAVRDTAGHVNDVVEANSLLNGQEADVFADSGYQGAHKRPDAKDGVQWHVAMRPGLRKLLDKASIRAKVEHPFRVIKRQFGHVKVRHQEHGAVAHAVCAGQSVDGAQAVERGPSMSAFGAWEMGAKRAHNTRRKTGQGPICSCQHAQPWPQLICADLP